MSRYVSLVGLALVAAPAITHAQMGGLGLSVQGEVGVGQVVRDLDTDEDVTYGALVGLHFAGPLSLEVEYQHSENDVKGLGGAATIDSDGVLGHVRFDLLPGPILPFVYGGVGWVRYSADAVILDVSDDTVVLPVGAGVELLLRPLVIGARGEYQWIANDVAGEDVDFWKVVGTIGFRIP